MTQPPQVGYPAAGMSRCLLLLALLAAPPVARASAPPAPGPDAGAGPAEVRDASVSLAEASPGLTPRDLRDDFARSEPPVDLEGGDELSLGWALLRTVVVLGMVVLLAWLTLSVGLRRLLGIKAAAPGGAVVEVLERVPLDQKRALFVVKAANEVLLIGGSENSLELITRLDPSEVEKLRAKGVPTLQMSPFLQKLLRRKDAPPPAT